MRTCSGLFDRLATFEHLEVAADFTIRGKRRRSDIAWFLFRREDELRTLRGELLSGRYRPEPFELITVRDPKPRLIARLPVRERIVENALVLLMEPNLRRRLCAEAYACRPGLGTHRAVLRLAELQRRFGYVVHLDIRKYFPSIDRVSLKGILRQRIRDTRFLELVDRVIDSAGALYDEVETRRLARLSADWPPPGRGLPIGSATSQFFAAQVVLCDFDHFVKRQLHVPGYLRYVDDLFLFDDSRERLRSAREAIAGWLLEERGLLLKRPRARVLSCRGTLDALGYRLRREGIECRPRAYRRVERRVTAALLRDPGGCDAESLERSLAASAGVVLF